MSDEYEYVKGRAAMNDAKPDRHYQNEAAPWGWLWPCSDDAYAILEGLRAPLWSMPMPARTAWECPRCHAINAPHVDRCACKEAP